jgi:hypothetical protein
MQIPVVFRKTDKFLHFTLYTFQRHFERQKNQLKIHIFGKFVHFYISIAKKSTKISGFLHFSGQFDNLVNKLG